MFEVTLGRHRTLTERVEFGGLKLSFSELPSILQRLKIPDFKIEFSLEEPLFGLLREIGNGHAYPHDFQIDWVGDHVSAKDRKNEGYRSFTAKDCFITGVEFPEFRADARAKSRGVLLTFSVLGPDYRPAPYKPTLTVKPRGVGLVGYALRIEGLSSRWPNASFKSISWRDGLVTTEQQFDSLSSGFFRPCGSGTWEPGYRVGNGRVPDIVIELPRRFAKEFTDWQEEKRQGRNPPGRTGTLLLLTKNDNYEKSAAQIDLGAMDIVSMSENSSNVLIALSCTRFRIGW